MPEHPVAVGGTNFGKCNVVSFVLEDDGSGESGVAGLRLSRTRLLPPTTGVGLPTCAIIPQEESTISQPAGRQKHKNKCTFFLYLGGLGLAATT